MRFHKFGCGAAAALLLAGCVQQPLGPTVNVMPPPTKPFEIFTQDQGACKQYADQQTAGAAKAANNKALATAIIGTALGAALGAAAGGGRGATVGASSGAVVGTAAAAEPAANDQMTLQERYDNAYAQCMYAHGDLVPGFAAPTAAAPAAPAPTDNPTPVNPPEPRKHQYQQ